ncbi:MAG: dTMP kinase [Syntrophomonadaceae bacterium]|nr:dTMP kinase [Syntrophomonadaceae bacterium]MDD3271394.1 dTMP kinase [Syntrophomonadaceae bacterium]MDD3898020.1 dTMP kinase [Syntrophomonadaceae bacterium]MDD4562446.1 dTMP kinase [Syntrophomonadaceae bacterium]
MASRGIFISLEGIDGSGKTSLQESLKPYMEQNFGLEVLGIREPGGNIISEKIRELLLDAANQGITSRTEALLYAAARSQVVEEVISPALQAGKIVLADRYMDSTIAYQGYGRGLDINFLQELNQLCTGGLKPDLTLLLDLGSEEAWPRRQKEIPDRLEKEGLTFQEKVRKGYLFLAEQEKERIKVLDARQEPEKVLQLAIRWLDEILMLHRE